MKDQRRKINGIVRSIKILAFALVLAVMSFIGLLWFARPNTSTVEKRTLTQFPQLTWTGFWDGSFFSQVDTWYADTYPLREGLISANQSLQNRYGLQGDQIVGNAVVADDIPDPDAEVEVQETTLPNPDETTEATTEETLADGTVSDLGDMAGSIYITNNAGYGLYYFSQSGAEQYAQTMNDIYSRVGDKVNLYVMVCPISAGVMLDETVLEDMGCSDQGAAIEYIYSKLDPGIHALQVFENLRAHNSEYIYFHTDHHWTQLGAYYAYEVFCKDKGWTAHSLDQFQTMTFEDFLGTYYSSSNKSPALASNPDTVTAYVPNGTNNMVMHMQDGSVYNWNVIYDVSSYDKSQLYATFVGGDRPLSYTHNETITDGSAVMVIKDSYGNAFIPWLVDHYEYVYWVDYRYTTNTISQMVADYGIQDVIYQCHIYNASTTSVLAEFAGIGQ